MTTNPKLPSYEEIFGELDFKAGDDGRSVLSPAAYLADLLQLLNDDLPVKDPIQNPGLYQRRADISALPLNTENTYTPIPYLDIVNTVLENKIKDLEHKTKGQNTPNNAYEILKSKTYPFNLPFNFEHERGKKILDYLQVSTPDLYKAFSQQWDPNLISRDALKLSIEEWNAILQESSEVHRQQYFGPIHFGPSPDSGSLNLEDFLKKTGLSGAELRELLYQDLSATAMDANGQPERVKATEFFVHFQLNSYVTLNATETALVWQGTPVEKAWDTWCDRVQRLIRLHTKIGLSFTELDLILRSCCHNYLDAAAMQTIAVIQHLCDRYNLPIDVICSFFSPMNIRGLGDEAEPKDLFNRTFNSRFAPLDRTYIPGFKITPPVPRSEFAPTAYAGYSALSGPEDILAASESSKTYRKRLCQALGLSDATLMAIIKTLRSKLTGPDVFTTPATLTLDHLSLLFRITRLSEILDFSPEDLFSLLDILSQDPSIRTHNNFNSLIPNFIQTQDCYQILAGGNISASLWLVQLLCALADWIQAEDLAPSDLKQWLTGVDKNEAAAIARHQQKIAFLNSLYQQFQSVMFESTLFESEQVDSRTARIIYQTLTEKTSLLVSSQDSRLVKFDPLLAAPAVYRGLTQLQRISPADFIGIGLESKMLDKIFNTLILREYITTEGQLIEENFPQSVEYFHLETDFTPQREALFGIIYDLVQGAIAADDPDAIASNDEMDDEDEFVDAADDEIENEFDNALEDPGTPPILDPGTNPVIDVALYPSDLESLTDLSDKQRDELYENLIFNGYIDEEGTVLQPHFFIVQGNVSAFKLDTDLVTDAAPIFNLIRSQTQRFHQAELKLDPDMFADLPLKPFEIDELIENLKFNQYINANQVLLNKAALLSETPATLNLALAFYPYRRAILQAIQGAIREFKSEFYTFNKEEFTAIADASIGRQVYRDIEPNYLRSGQLTEAAAAFFLDSDNLALFRLGSAFTANDTAIVFRTLQTLVTTAQGYAFTPDVLEELDFDEEEQLELIDILHTTGYLLDHTHIAWDKISYFLVIDNALEFTLAGFEDYNKDIFFALHAIAKQIDADVQEITSQFQALAETQSRVLFEALQDHFGVDTEIIATLCQQILQTPSSIVEAFLIPTLGAVNIQGVITTEPQNDRFNRLYRRMGQFAAIAAQLGLTAIETAIVWQDQDLVEKFPEKLVLPPEVERFDALLDNGKGAIYLFLDNQYWTYSATHYTLLSPISQPLTTLSPLFAGIPKVEAAFTDANGHQILIAQGKTYRQAKGSDRWVEQSRIWGQVKSNFEHPQRIDTTFQDKAGKIYLFSGDQYIRYSSDDYSVVDEGYPLSIEQHWRQDALTVDLPPTFKRSIDASFQDSTGHTYLFKDHHYLCLESSEAEGIINQTWGKVRNNFENLDKIDAAYSDGAEVFLFAGDQVIAYSDSLENAQVTVKEGFPKRLRTHYTDLPAEFVDGVEAAFKGADGITYLFKGGTLLPVGGDRKASTEKVVKEVWGRVRNTIVKSGRMDAAFVGLDGKTYLFSDDQFVRYSGADYAQVDVGYPRTIEQDWGGLNHVDAAFIFNGKTYLFGTAPGHEGTVYVRYSTPDYTTVDAGYPKPPNDNWWNLPFSLVEEGAPFNTIDTVLNASDNKIYLFSGSRFIYFDQQQRWWSEPQDLATQWDSIPFTKVDAAFSGKDGKTYLFSDTKFIQYSGQNYSRTDDRTPSQTKRYWGHVANNIAKTGRVDAALVVEFAIAGKPEFYTYLFSGNQYFRYTGNQYTEVDEGYPKLIATSLKQEPRFQNLAMVCDDGIDAALADQRHIYLFKKGQCHVISDSLYKVYTLPQGSAIACAFGNEGTIFVADTAADTAGWSRHSHLEGHNPQKTPMLPPHLRSVLDNFKTGLEAVLVGVDRNTYLFKGTQCFNVSLNKAYPLNEEWGRVKNNIDVNNTIDAAFVGRDGKTYVFSGDQYVSYAAPIGRQAGGQAGKTLPYTYGDVEQLPRPIKEQWGGLTRISLAFVKDEKTYLFEPADAQGNARYLCYSTADYSQPDAGFPKVGDRSFWQIPLDYRNDGFVTVDAVLFEADNMFLLSGQQYIQFNTATEQWTPPKPLARIWREIPFDKSSFQRIKTAFTGSDGVTYFFADEYFVAYAESKFTTSPIPIRERWGRLRNNFAAHPQGNRVDAAFVFQGKTTYLFSRDQYVRYSSKDYRYVDAGYPKPIANNLRTEVGFENLPEAVEQAIASATDRVIQAIVASDRTLYLLISDPVLGQQWHAVSQNLTATYPLSRYGRLKNNLVQQNRVDAALCTPNGQTFLFTGDQGVRYSGDTYTYVDDGYPKALATILTEELGMTRLSDGFKYSIDAVLQGGDGTLYVFKDQNFQRSNAAKAQPINEYWGKVKNNFVVDPANPDPTGRSLDAAFIAPTGQLYAFKGDQYIQYTNPDQVWVDAGFPKRIKDHWGNLPIGFEEGINAGFVFEDKTYLIKDTEYVRYSTPTYERMDAIYPQMIKNRWGNWSDYLLSDLKTITRFKQLQDTYRSGESTLSDFLQPENGPVTDPYQMLATLFGWDIEEVKWLKRKNAFLSATPVWQGTETPEQRQAIAENSAFFNTDNLFEHSFKLEMILRMFDIFAIAQTMGTTPSELYQTVWEKRYALDPKKFNLQQAADALYRFLALIHRA